jgi:hypothetical protein
MRIALSIISVSLLLFSGLSCKKGKSGPVIKIEGFLITDNIGNSLYRISPMDQDWTLMPSLSDAEMALFDFPTPYNLDNTLLADVQLPVQAFPNPMAHRQAYVTNVSDSVLLKLVVVDEYLKVKNTASLKSKGSMVLMMDFTNRTEFPISKAYRVYYSYSSAIKQNYKVGYGDIMICNTLSTSGPESMRIECK